MYGEKKNNINALRTTARFIYHIRGFLTVIISCRDHICVKHVGLLLSQPRIKWQTCAAKNRTLIGREIYGTIYVQRGDQINAFVSRVSQVAVQRAGSLMVLAR